MIDILAQLLPGTDTFSSVELNTAIGAGTMSALLLAVGFWIKRYMNEKYRQFIPAILMVVGMVTFIAYSGFNLSTVIFAFLASNSAVGLYEGGKAVKRAATPTSG